MRGLGEGRKKDKYRLYSLGKFRITPEIKVTEGRDRHQGQRLKLTNTQAGLFIVPPHKFRKNKLILIASKLKQMHTDLRK